MKRGITDRYTSKNGYTGVLFGKSEYSIYDKNGKAVFHTGSRAFNSHDELVKQVDEFPQFIKLLTGEQI